MSHSVATDRMRVARVDGELTSSPINADWVLEGTPAARVSEWAESTDGTTSHWTWDCSAGTFRWYYDVDESIVIVDGCAIIAVDGDAPVRLEVGDAAYFPAGHWTTWTVPTYVRKQAVVRVPVPRTLSYVVKGFGRRLHRLT